MFCSSASISFCALTAWLTEPITVSNHWKIPSPVLLALKQQLFRFTSFRLNGFFVKG